MVLTHGLKTLTCVFAWLHLDLNLGSKNANSFHWTKFWYVMLHTKVVEIFQVWFWVHSLNYIIIYEGRKNASCTVQHLWCRSKKSRSVLYLLLLFRQYPNMTEWRYGFYPYHFFVPNFKSHVLLSLPRS